jgi:hypothetical protein
MNSDEIIFNALLLPKEKHIQLHTLIRNLGDGWDTDKIELTLKVLNGKDKAVKWSSNILIKTRTISIRQFNHEERDYFISSLKADEKALFEELEKWKSRRVM